MIGQWLKGNKEQQRVILAILRPAFFFISCSEVSSATVQKGVPEGQKEHLLPGSLASGRWTVSLGQTGGNVRLRNIPTSKRPSLQQEQAL